MELTASDVEEGTRSLHSLLCVKKRAGVGLTESDIGACCVAYLLETRRYRRDGSSEPVLDQVGAARADWRQNICPMALAAHDGAVTDDWKGLAIALYAGMIKPIAEDRRSDAVCLGASLLAAARARAHTKRAFERARLRYLQSEPDFAKALQQEMARVA